MEEIQRSAVSFAVKCFSGDMIVATIWMTMKLPKLIPRPPYAELTTSLPFW